MRSYPSRTLFHAAGLLLAGLTLSACDPKLLLGEFLDSDTGAEPDDGGDTAVSSAGESSLGASETGAADTDWDDSTDSAPNGDDSGSGESGEDSGGPFECDSWAQDCPAGEKCNLYHDASLPQESTWNALKCVEVAPSPQPVGAPCELTGTFYSGEDDCGVGAMCWDVDLVTGVGHCVALCEGSPQAPICDPGTLCVTANEGVLNVCLTGCDPLAPNCLSGQTCIANPGEDNNFVCVLDASGAEGQAFDECEFANGCDPGLLCANPDLASECSGLSGCCLPFCDLNESNTCPGVDQECLPWFDANQAPLGLDHVGVCGLAP